MVGASGAISGVLGAYLVRYPRNKVLVLIPFGFFTQMVRIPAMFVLGFWFILQFISSSGSSGQGGVAYGAHIGGFVFGAVVMFFFGNFLIPQKAFFKALNEKEDKEEIMTKFEGEEGDEYNPEEMGGEEGMEDEGGLSDEELGLGDTEGEMGEGFDDYGTKHKFKDYDSDDFREIKPDHFEQGEFDLKVNEGGKSQSPREARIKHPDIKDHESHRIEDILETVFSESKVDSILRGYFKIDENERRLIESKKKEVKLTTENKKVKINKIKQLSESISQEVGARKLMEKYPSAKLVGKTNKSNLVFEMNNKQLRINTKGQII